jgi:integrase
LRKLQQVSVDLENGTYIEPSKLTVGQWLDIWTAEYLGSVKPRTAETYDYACRVHLKPSLGMLKLTALSAHIIQGLYNKCQRDKGLSPKTIKNLNGVLHKALQQAVKLGYIKFNPCDACELPRIEKKEVKPLDDEAIKEFLTAIQGQPWENLFIVTLFTGMRQGEVLGLTWSCIDFKNGTILINRQRQRSPTSTIKPDTHTPWHSSAGAGPPLAVSPSPSTEYQGATHPGLSVNYGLATTKNSKNRRISSAPSVMAALKDQRRRQAVYRILAGSLWTDSDFVFTNELGRPPAHCTISHTYKRIVKSLGYPGSRFHDLRHSYAVAALQAGDDVKTVQETLGHHTAAFTLDVYGHVTEKMKQESAARMEQFIQRVKKSG